VRRDERAAIALGLLKKALFLVRPKDVSVTSTRTPAACA
jgi:hypothetical protein